MTRVLLDANLTGFASRLRETLRASGWLEVTVVDFVTFPDLDLSFTMHDRAVWHVVQQQQLLLLTDNRNMAGADSLERTLREELLPSSLPILTVGSRNRLAEPEYRSRCVERLVEIIVDPENLRGTPRLFIP